MAGSKKWFNYQMDDGTNVGVLLDESNTEAVNGAAANTPPAATAPTRQVPRGTRLRSIYYENTDGTRVIKVVALNPTIYGGVPANLRTITDPITGTGNLTFVRKRPEVVKSPVFGTDTGLTDGDNP
jgi:hypothetical protein